MGVNKVGAQTCELVVEYATEVQKGKEQAEIAKPIKSVKMNKIVSDEAAEYIEKLTKKQVFKLILAANYMDNKDLLHLGCAKIATLIKGKSPEEIKKILGSDEADETTRPAHEADADNRRRLYNRLC